MTYIKLQRNINIKITSRQNHLSIAKSQKVQMVMNKDSVTDMVLVQYICKIVEKLRSSSMRFKYGQNMIIRSTLSSRVWRLSIIRENMKSSYCSKYTVTSGGTSEWPSPHLFRGTSRVLNFFGKNGVITDAGKWAIQIGGKSGKTERDLERMRSFADIWTCYFKCRRKGWCEVLSQEPLLLRIFTIWWWGTR